MRTTIDLPDDVHQVALALSRDLRQSLSATVALLVRRGLNAAPSHEDGAASEVRVLNGFPVLHGGRTTTTEDVRGLDDEE